MVDTTFKRELIAKAFNLSKRVIKLVDRFPLKQSSRIITNQMLRAITSIAANIIEAQAASSKKDFINFLNHALKSANESKFWLALSYDIAPNHKEEITILKKEVDELSKILGSSIATMKGQRKF
jgi:four helix bundle protein